jgi:hypothetical protein
VPLVVIGPPVKPEPELIRVTEPPAEVDEIVTEPVLALMAMPAPATRFVTPVLVTMTFPTPPAGETLMPVPEMI